MSKIPTPGELAAGLSEFTKKSGPPDWTGGKVTGFFPGGEPKITFDGETAPRPVVLTRLSPALPALGARVILRRALGGWIYWTDYTVR